MVSNEQLHEISSLLERKLIELNTGVDCWSDVQLALFNTRERILETEVNH